MCSKVLGEQRSIGVRIVAADNDEAVELESLCMCTRRRELRGRLDLVTARTNDIKAAHVAIFGHERRVDDNMLAGHEALGSIEEANKCPASRASSRSLKAIKEPRNDAVTASSLATAQHHSHTKRTNALCRATAATCLKMNSRPSKRCRKQLSELRSIRRWR